MRKRYYLKNKKRFATVLFVVFLMIFAAGSITAASAGNFQTKKEIIIVRPGDTLWEIAAQYSNDVEIRKYIYHIRKLNDLESATIYAGQRIRLP